MRFPKEIRPHVDPGRVNRGTDARPDGEDKSTIMSDGIIPGRQAAIGTVRAVTPDDDWFDPDLTVQDMPRPEHRDAD
jgi:hypothetical protein